MVLMLYDFIASSVFFFLNSTCSGEAHHKSKYRFKRICFTENECHMWRNSESRLSTAVKNSKCDLLRVLCLNNFNYAVQLFTGNHGWMGKN